MIFYELNSYHLVIGGLYESTKCESSPGSLGASTGGWAGAGRGVGAGHEPAALPSSVYRVYRVQWCVQVQYTAGIQVYSSTAARPLTTSLLPRAAPSQLGPQVREAIMKLM